MQRVHVVSEPLTDYLRFEITGYRLNVEAGEDVRILPRRQQGAWACLTTTSGCSTASK